MEFITCHIYEPELNYDKAIFIKLRKSEKSCCRHYICLRPTEQKEEDLNLHNGITNDRRLYLIIKSKGTFIHFFSLHRAF